MMLKRHRLPAFGVHWTPSIFDKLDDFERVATNTLTPAMEVSEGESGYNVCVEIPGMEKSDINVELTNGILTISGEKKSKEKNEDENLYSTERIYGCFTRKLKFPDIDNDKVTAEYKDGILEITVAKLEDAKPKQVLIG
jgi:HSP20 family protein